MMEYICVLNNKLTKLNDLEVLPRLIAVDAAKNKVMYVCMYVCMYVAIHNMFGISDIL